MRRGVATALNVLVATFTMPPGTGALVVPEAAVFNANVRRIGDLAWTARLPGIGPAARWPEAGGLLAYGPNTIELWRRGAAYADKILRGARPAELAIAQPTTFELIINLKSAKALGRVIPQPLLLRADEVIQ